MSILNPSRSRPFLKILSYLFPIRLERQHSRFNERLDVILFHGELQLNSRNANYSFGPLHEVMKRALSAATEEFNPTFNRILLLGYGGGSAARIIKEEYNPTAQITAVEIDQIVISIAQKWFYTEDVYFERKDAAEFVQNTPGKWDLIISDVFVDKSVPGYFKTAEYLSALRNLLDTNGVLIQNIIIPYKDIDNLFFTFNSVFPVSGKLRVYGLNSVFVGKK